jgi:ABC-type Zn uptake system ZnuABC Zn-binding protein ZnuA
MVVTTGQGVLFSNQGTSDRTQQPHPTDTGSFIWLDPENVKTMLRHITDA